MADVLGKLGSRATALALGTLILFVVACGGSSTAAAGSTTDVTVWTAWGGTELKAFQDVLKPFHDKTGITVHLTTVRDANQLAINVDAGTSLPDIAQGPSVDKVQS
jgi:ABC-type glycerol-3-phosphate transport system substrate-binding protein